VVVYAEHSLCHARSIALIFNLQIGHVSLQYHVIFDDVFTTAPHMWAGTKPPNWKTLVELNVGLAMEKDFELASAWSRHLNAIDDFVMPSNEGALSDEEAPSNEGEHDNNKEMSSDEKKHVDENIVNSQPFSPVAELRQHFSSDSNSQLIVDPCIDLNVAGHRRSQ